jgi:putative SOS response-associated peptidase YedK
MCGRYELSSHPAAIALAFGLPLPPVVPPRYNIAPMQQVPIVRLNAEGERELMFVRWGFVPRWAKDPSIGARMINARAETVSTRYAFHNAYARHRCLLPANGFYEWRATHSGKQPMHIGMADGHPFGLAGVYERWLSPDGEVLDTCAIVTTAASASLRDVHDRMPVIVPASDYGRWLDSSTPDVADLLGGWTGPLHVYPVSTRVNAVRNDDPQLCAPIDVTEVEDRAAAQHAIPTSARTGAADGARGEEEPEEAKPDTEEPVQATLF